MSVIDSGFQVTDKGLMELFRRMEPLIKAMFKGVGGDVDAPGGIEFTANGVYGSVNTGDGLEVHTTTSTGQLYDAGLHNITLKGGVNSGHTLGQVLIGPTVQTVSGDPAAQTEWTVGSISDSEISGFARLYRLQLGGGNTSHSSGDLDVRDHLGNQVFLVRDAGGSNEMIFKDRAGGALIHAGIVAGPLDAVGVFGALAAQQTVAGSRAGNVALANLLTALANYGLIIDSTTP